MEKMPEAWLRGPIEGVPPALQPVAHALVQANEEIHEILKDFPDDLLWKQPEDVASVAFHLQHIPGVLDRLFSYANTLQLSNPQLKYLSEEGLEDASITTKILLKNLDDKIKESIARLKTFDPKTLTDARGVGRKQLPSTTLGLLFHAAEHTMRHTGQLIVTARIVKREA
ncbi:MAG: DinB family protein [Chitinophagaceae bacterium]|nr:DinB family protein [Chitinophagaceae bacterium]